MRGKFDQKKLFLVWVAVGDNFVQMAIFASRMPDKS
jgi:hypothetical protein